MAKRDRKKKSSMNLGNPGIFDEPDLGPQSISSIEILADGRLSRQQKHKGSFFGSGARFNLMVKKAPEVMVKVTGGGKSMGQIKSHLEYISRNGKLDLITSEDEILRGNDETRGYAEAWEIDSRPNAGRFKQAENIMLSMPKGTDPAIVKEAALAFAREQFGDIYPWAMALHTDKDHPHVHICVRRTPEDRREPNLNIRKSTLESWRQSFCDRLNERGIEATATRRPYRGVIRKPKSLNLHHAEKNGRSQVQRQKISEVVREIQEAKRNPQPWKTVLARHRKRLIQHYNKAADELEAQGKKFEAAKTRNFIKDLPPLKTERDRYREAVIEYARGKESYPQQEESKIREVETKLSEDKERPVVKSEKAPER